jgi:hypothetical protein
VTEFELLSRKNSAAAGPRTAAKPTRSRRNVGTLSDTEAKEQCKDNIVAQPVAAKSVYRQEEQANEDEWDNGTAVKPPLGGFTGGQPDKEKKAAKSAEGKAAFRLAQFKNVVLVGDGP